MFSSSDSKRLDELEFKLDAIIAKLGIDATRELTRGEAVQMLAQICDILGVKCNSFEFDYDEIESRFSALIQKTKS